LMLHCVPYGSPFFKLYTLHTMCKGNTILAHPPTGLVIPTASPAGGSHVANLL